MAKQAGDYFIEGTIDDLTFYKMEGKYYVRMKSSLTGKKFWKHKAFEGSRKSAVLLGKASGIASLFYRGYPKEKKYKGLFNAIVGKAKLWLKDGKCEEEIMLLLQQHYPTRKKENKNKNEIKSSNRIIPLWMHDDLFVIPYYKPAVKNKKRYCIRE